MNTLKVLVIEDEQTMRAAVRRALERHEVTLPEVEGACRFAVLEAGSAEDGLAIIDASPPDIVLLDHQLPGMSGVELLAVLAERQPAPEFLTVMMTAYATLENAVLATKRGAEDFLAKPFTPDELRAVVDKTARHLLVTREARRLAREKSQVRFQLLSVIVHELKAPLNAIQGYLWILKDLPPDDDPAVQAKAIDRCLVRIEGMRKLVMDLLDMTRLESGQKRRELARLDLRDVARGALDSVSPEAAARGIRLNLSAPDEVPVTADRGEMDIVLNNLLTNAVKYNRDGGSVDVALSCRAGRACIVVSDTGIGMAPEDRARLFGEFVRIRNDQTRDIAGSGLGLSILRKLARLYGGDVTVTSEPGVGSIFTVEFSSEPTATLLESTLAPA